MPGVDALAETTADPASPTGERGVAGEPAPGSTIGRFTITGLLGRGGMGVVLSAHDPKLDRAVAIKLVHTGGASSETEALHARLLREARAMARLRHPNVVSVYEVGEQAGQIYLAMEQVEGGTLRDALAGLGERPDWQRVLPLFADAGRGLAAAHAAGLVHRDFKPDNVLIDRDGRALVSDFGLVRAGEPELARVPSGATPASDVLTRADVILGSPAYMAPEQWADEEVDARSDQFAFCVALYEALYGELPFAGDRRDTYAAAVVAGALRPPPASRATPPWLREVLVRGLATDPDDRFASMRDLLVELGSDERNEQVGGRERDFVVVGLGLFVVVWAAAALGFEVKPSYPLHYATDTTFLVLCLALGWLARDALARTAFNRKIYALVVATSISVLILTVGGQILATPPVDLASYHLLLIGSMVLASATNIDRRLALVGAVYFACFLGSTLEPRIIFPVIFTAHLVASTTIFLLLRARQLDPAEGHGTR